MVFQASYLNKLIPFYSDQNQTRTVEDIPTYQCRIEAFKSFFFSLGPMNGIK